MLYLSFVFRLGMDEGMIKRLCEERLSLHAWKGGARLVASYLEKSKYPHASLPPPDYC